jgi:hypothetical protein
VNGLAAADAAANVGCGDVAGDAFEEIDRAAQEMGDDLRGMLGLSFLFGVTAGYQVGWNDKAQRFSADAGAIGNEEVAETEQSLVFLPHGNIEESVGADDEEDVVAVTVIDMAEMAHSINGIMKLRAAKVLAGFGKRGNEVRVLGAGERNHGEAVRKRREVLFELVRRPAGGNEMNFVEIKTAVGGAGDGEMAVVNRVERAAKKCDAARMMFCGGAVRLRCGQCASQRAAVHPERFGVLKAWNNSLTNLFHR